MTGLLLLTAPPATGEAPNPWIQFVPIALILGIMYFLVLAPARKQRKQTQTMLDGLKAGDKVVTTGGLHGTVVGLDGDVVKIRIATSVHVDISKSAVASRLDDAGEGK